MNMQTLGLITLFVNLMGRKGFKVSEIDRLLPTDLSDSEYIDLIQTIMNPEIAKDEIRDQLKRYKKEQNY